MSNGGMLWVDRYGNAQLNVDPDEISAFGDQVTLVLGDQRRLARRAVTYADLKPGEIGLVVDSYGLVSVCLDRQSAAAELGLGPGDEVQLEHAGDRPGGVTSNVTLRLGQR